MLLKNYVEELQKILEKNPEYENLDVVYINSFDCPYKINKLGGPGCWDKNAEEWTYLENDLDDLFDDDKKEKKEIIANAFCVN